MKCSLKLLALGIGLLLSAFYRITDAADGKRNKVFNRSLNVSILVSYEPFVNFFLASNYFVRSLPGLPDNSNLKLHAG